MAVGLWEVYCSLPEICGSLGKRAGAGVWFPELREQQERTHHEDDEDFRVRRARARPEVANLEERVLLDAAGGSMHQSRFQALRQRRQMLIQRMEARRIARLQHLGITYQGSLTYQYNQMRTGLNTSETTLTPANVNSASFGKLGSYKVDGLVYAQPLYVSGVQRYPGRGRGQNLVIVATENDSVYAIDPNHRTPDLSTTGWSGRRAS